MLIRESTDFDESIEDDLQTEEQNTFNSNENAVQLIKSKDLTDKRIFNIYRLKRWKEDYKIHKGKSIVDLSCFKEKQLDKKDDDLPKAIVAEHSMDQFMKSASPVIDDIQQISYVDSSDSSFDQSVIQRGKFEGSATMIGHQFSRNF